MPSGVSPRLPIKVAPVDPITGEQSTTGYIPRATAQLVRAAAATGAFQTGDAIAQSTTGSACSAMTFTITPGNGQSGILSGASCVVTAGSGTIVISGFDFYLWLFRPDTDIPFAAGSFPADNAACNISAAAMKQCVGIVSFTASGWINQAGANAAAGDHVYQAAMLNVRNFSPFSLTGLSAATLKGIIQAKGAWNPGNVAQTFDFALDFLGA